MEIKNVCIIGMGFIGTTLAAVLAEAGFCVFGIEKDKEKLELLKQAKPHFHEKGLPELLSKQLNKNLFVFDKIPDGKKIDAFIISVATPVDEATKKPDLSYIKSAVEDLLPHLKEGQLVMLRSTVPVGTTRNFVFPMLEEKGKNIYLSFCPERTVEGKALEELKTLPQIIGELDNHSGDLSAKIFSQITPAIVRTSSLEAAEIIKLINNSYRDFNFAFANQTALFVGGVCLEKDPHILASSSDINVALIKAARELNEGLISHVFDRARKHLKEKNIPISHAKIFISGFAFKGHPETDDMRGSPAVNLVKFFKKLGIKDMFGHDFVVSPENVESSGVKFCSIEKGFKTADVLIFMNNHKKYNDINISGLVENMKDSAFLFDGWQIFSDKIKGKNINYESIGFKKAKN